MCEFNLKPESTADLSNTREEARGKKKDNIQIITSHGANSGFTLLYKLMSLHSTLRYSLTKEKNITT
jgi:hypothetical protein